MIVTSATRAAALLAAKAQNNLLVGWDNLGAGATLSGTAVLANGQRENAVDGNTYDHWLPDVTGTEAILRFDFAAPVTIPLVAIAGHNAGSLGATVRVERSTDGATWSDGGAGVASPADDRPIAWRMVETGADAAHWRIRFQGLTAGDPLRVAVAFLGPELLFPDRQYRGFAPALVPTDVEVQSNVSVGGNLLGSVVTKRGSTLQLALKSLPQPWVRANLPGFLTHFAEVRGFFLAWRPGDHPEDLHYGWRSGEVPRPSITGPVDLMGLSMAVRVHEVAR